MNEKTLKPTLTRKDFVSDQDVRWCPGCGDYSILTQTQKLVSHECFIYNDLLQLKHVHNINALFHRTLRNGHPDRVPSSPEIDPTST